MTCRVKWKEREGRSWREAVKGAQVTAVGGRETGWKRCTEIG